MSRALRRHTREMIWRSSIALPILVLLGFQFMHAQRGADRRIGIIVDWTTRPLSIDNVRPEGPGAASGLRAGDALLAIAGREIAETSDYDQAAKLFARGVPVTFEIERDGERVAVAVVPGMDVNRLPLLVNSFIVLLYLTMGLVTIARRPGSMPSNLLYALFFLAAAEVAMPSLLIGEPLIEVINTAAFYLITGLQFGTEFHLISLIPQRPGWLRRRPWLVPLYYSVGFGAGLLASVTFLVEDVWRRDAFPWSYRGLATFISDEFTLFWAAALVVILVHTIWHHPGPRGRLQAALVLGGLLTWTLYIYVTGIADLMDFPLPIWFSEYWSLSLLPLPLSIFVMLRLEDAVRNNLLRNLIEEVQEAGSIEKISQLISKKLNLAFYTKCNYVFFRESRDSAFSSIHSWGAEHETEGIPDDYEIIRIADQKGETLVYPGNLAETLPDRETEWLDCLQANLIVPLVESDGHMTGLLILGQKRSEEPYTPDDLELLRSLARQIVMAHENIGLQVKIHERERIQRQVLDRLEGQEISPVKECPACGFCYDTGDETCPRDGSALTLTLPVERLVDGRYRLEQVLGRGGAAVVYLASDVRLNRGVAVKVLSLSLLDDVVAPRRFEREARVAAQLLHPNIVTTHDFGKTRNGLPYIAMEYLEGRTLRHLIKQQGGLDGATAAGWFTQILDGLGAAHALGVVHRDLKPDNVFILSGPREEEVVKLLDFGLAKIQTRTQEESFTSPGMIMGTLSYMAPEQLSGQGIDRRADLYAIGVMAYEAVTGRRPFEGRSPAQVLTAILKGEFDFPDEPQAQDLRRVLERCFQQKSARRYGSVAELRKELIPALAACGRLASTRAAV